MRFWRFLLLILFAGPLVASQPVPVEKLKQEIARLRVRADADAAYLLADIRLRERLSPEKEAELRGSLPGPLSRDALAAVAAESQFLPGAASPTAAPDRATQRQIMARVVEYVVRTMPQLPNLVATRNTLVFEDTPQVQEAHGFVPFQPLHRLREVEDTIAWRDSKEVLSTVNAKTGTRNRDAGGEGLTTHGIFGPVVGTVLLDAARNQIEFARWEAAPSGELAVFRFTVPEAASHYEVDYCCVAEQMATNIASSATFHRFAGYSGELAVEADTGVVRRLMLTAKMHAGDPVEEAALLVDYGPVEIGGRPYICPVRSLAHSRAHAVQVDPVFHQPVALMQQPLKMAVSVAAFSDYHIFRSELRMVSEDEARAAGVEPPAPVAAPQNAGLEPAQAVAGGAAPEPSLSAAVSTQAAAPKAAAVADPGAVPPEPPEVATEKADEFPDRPAGESGFTLRTTTRLVDVSVLVYDRKGRRLTNLKPDEITVEDNGRPQKIQFLAEPQGPGDAGAPRAAAKAGDGDVKGTSNLEPAGTPPAHAGGPGSVVLLIDSSNVAFDDLNNARRQILKFLTQLSADQPAGLYVLESFGFKTLIEPTTDHQAVAARLASWVPRAEDLARAQFQEQRNRQQFDTVMNIADLMNVNGNTPTGSMDSLMAMDPKLRSLGDHPALESMARLAAVARHLGTIAGHKSLVWVASDNVLADFSDKAPDAEKGEKHLGPLELAAREALNEAHASLYPMDVSQLEAGGVSAALRSGNVQLSQVKDPAMEVLKLSPEKRQEAMETLDKSRRDINPGRVTAMLQQDAHQIQGVFRELAAATGGRTLRRAGDLTAELDGIAADSRSAYMVSFAPDTQPDNQFHHLVVKVNRPGVTVHSRTGYLYAAEPTTMKDRIRQAIWRPGESTQVPLTVVPAESDGKRMLRITIGAAGISPELRAGRYMARVHILFAVRDDDKLRVALSGRTLALRLKPETWQRAQQEGITIEEPAPAAPEGVPGLVRLLVIDENSGQIGSLTLPDQRSR